MKIGRTHQQQPIEQARGDRASGAREKAAPSGSRTLDPVRLSDTGRRLAAARGPEVPDGARVEHLRRLLSDGKLPVDVEAITDAILREER